MRCDRGRHVGNCHIDIVMDAFQFLLRQRLLLLLRDQKKVPKIDRRQKKVIAVDPTIAGRPSPFFGSCSASISKYMSERTNL